VVRLKVPPNAGLGKTGTGLFLKPCLARESALFPPKCVNGDFQTPSAFSLSSFSLTTWVATLILGLLLKFLSHLLSNIIS